MLERVAGGRVTRVVGTAAFSATPVLAPSGQANELLVPAERAIGA